MKKQLVMTFTLLVLSTQVWADQCSTLPNDKAIHAKKLISKFIKSNEIAVIDIFCEACMDTTPKALVAENVELKNFQVKGYQEIYLNDKPIDLAYTYINGENIANLIGCKTIGVEKFL